uniref:Response regulator n=1 Tax=candidate division WOR-3 bacterium TaxID=2052148 RepID=A0A7C6A8N7_UNCW3
MDKKRILLVDDEPEMLEVNSVLLQSYGYEILQAKDGLAALEMINHNPPDLILLDLMIPGIDGIQLCALLKHNKNLKKIPILVLSARFSEDDKKTAKTAGADGYITKPFEPQTLLAKIEELLASPSACPVKSR